MAEWISVADRKPEPGKCVLAVWPMVWIDEDDTRVRSEVHHYVVRETEFLHNGHFDDPVGADAIGGWFGDDYQYADQPTHWMPMPDLPVGLTVTTEEQFALVR